MTDSGRTRPAEEALERLVGFGFGQWEEVGGGSKEERPLARFVPGVTGDTTSASDAGEDDEGDGDGEWRCDTTPVVTTRPRVPRAGRPTQLTDFRGIPSMAWESTPEGSSAGVTCHTDRERSGNDSAEDRYGREVVSHRGVVSHHGCVVVREAGQLQKVSSRDSNGARAGRLDLETTG